MGRDMMPEMPEMPATERDREERLERRRAEIREELGHSPPGSITAEQAHDSEFSIGRHMIAEIAAIYADVMAEEMAAIEDLTLYGSAEGDEPAGLLQE